MSRDMREDLQARLDQNYSDYLEQLKKKPFAELIKLAPEITAAQQLRDELAAVCDDSELEYLLGLDHPLEVTRGYWEREISGYDHGDEMGRMLWVLRGQDRPSKTPPPASEAKIHHEKRKNTHER